MGKHCLSAAPPAASYGLPELHGATLFGLQDQSAGRVDLPLEICDRPG